MTRQTLAVVCGFALGFGNSLASAAKEGLAVGESVTSFALKTLNPGESKENQVRLDDYYGEKAKTPKKAILLTFFATYCEPCKREMPFLAELYEMYRERGLMVVSVSIDKDADQIALVSGLAKKNGVTYPVVSDRFNIVAKRYLINKLPCVYVVDGQGKVTLASVGYSDDISKQLLDNIRQAVGEPLDAPVPPTLAKHMKGNKGKATVDVVSDKKDPDAGPAAAKAGE